MTVTSMAKKLRPLEPRNLALAVDLELERAWRVEYFDSDGAGYITVFAGQSAEVRARDYYDAIERGALDTRIADAQVVTAKTVVRFPQKGRRPPLTKLTVRFKPRTPARSSGTRHAGVDDERVDQNNVAPFWKFFSVLSSRNVSIREGDSVLIPKPLS